MRIAAVVTLFAATALSLQGSVSAYNKRSAQLEDSDFGDTPFVLHPPNSMQDPNPEIHGLGGYQPDVPSKRDWPELVGTDATEAKETLEKETDLNVLLVKSGSMVTMDFRTNRIRIWYDPATNKVIKAPKVG